ncbi:MULTISPECIES: ATP-binding cassette domain-containing protein [unclassified Streptomyces]|uniref:ATP-binding cassette domain-containing protein n=1 Tax=unclassified Streptomyces TaxID=2593676 RepID=UPI000CD5690A|nr:MULTISPECIES: ATP-binding cassette domain-containing protein [unclassified Streptomyces]
MPITFDACTFGYRRGRPVFDGLSVELPHGSVVLLGPNGAGKSTLMSLAATASRPWSGRLRLGTLDAADRGQRRAWRRRVSWLPQSTAPYPGLTVREQVAHSGWLKGMSRSDAWEASERSLRRVGLADLAERSGSHLSGGQLRRAGIAQALVHDADVILMDEPSAGLDPVQYGTLRELLRTMADDVTFVVSTHDSRDLAETYSQVLVLTEGTVRFQGTVTEFLALAPGEGEELRRAESAYRGLVGAEG